MSMDYVKVHGITVALPFKDFNAIENLFLKHKPKVVLEWGIGGSTLVLSKLSSITKWIGIEHSSEWISLVKEQAGSKVELHLKDLDKDYTTFPLDKNLEPDLIFIDGRLRSQCIKVAHSIIKFGCPVIVHDSCRERYWRYMRLFSRKEVLTKGFQLVDKLSGVNKDSGENELYAIDKIRDSRGLYCGSGVTVLYKDNV